jgi:hypothetical protein
MDDIKFYYALCDKEQEITKETQKLNQALLHIQALKEQFKPSESIMSIADSTEKMNDTIDFVKKIINGSYKGLPETYSPDLTQKQKVFIALKKISYGDTNAIAKELVKLDDKFDFAKAKIAVTGYAFQLSKEGIIGAQKKGYKNMYFIKEAVGTMLKDYQLEIDK